MIAGRDSALSTWRKVYTLYRIGGKGGEAEKEAQAREQYYLFRSNAEQALELVVRHRIQAPLPDGTGRHRRPAHPAQGRAHHRQGGLRLVRGAQRRFGAERRVAAAKMERQAARDGIDRRQELPPAEARFRCPISLARPGQRLVPRDAAIRATDFTQPNSNAYESLTNGQFQEWQLGFQLNMPLGFRREMAGVRNAQLALARERAILQEAELELSHQLAWAIRDLEKNYVLSQTEFNRRIAAQREVEAVTAAYETDTVTIDRVLEAQRALAQAESDFYQSLVDYNKAIAQVHFRKGSLLEYNGVYLAEGPWPGKAYFDARRRARARDAATYLDYGFTQPRVISRGPIQQNVGGGAVPGRSDGGSRSGPEPDAKHRTAGIGADARGQPGPTERRAGRAADLEGGNQGHTTVKRGGSRTATPASGQVRWRPGDCGKGNNVNLGESSDCYN